MSHRFPPATYLIEARSYRIAFAWCHNFWVLKNASLGTAVAELHGLAYDRLTQKILPIGTTRHHSLRVFVFAHDSDYAATLGIPVGRTGMFAKSRARTVYDQADSLARWNAAVTAMSALNALDLDYPPYGFNVLSTTINSNSAYRTLGEIMGVPVKVFRSFAPGLRSRMIGSRPDDLAKLKRHAESCAQLTMKDAHERARGVPRLARVARIAYRVVSSQRSLKRRYS